jgi:hypothetical protein
MARAVHRAEQAVGRVRDRTVELGDLPMLMQRLRVVAGQVDRHLVLQAQVGIHQASFEDATRQAAQVISASTRIEYAATSSVERPATPRERSIATSVEREASAILDELAGAVDTASEQAAGTASEQAADTASEQADKRSPSDP